jgi:autotransporter-associated beta strand protein
MFGTGTININENGQLDFNGASDTIGNLVINATGAIGDTTPIKNSGSGGNVTWGSLWQITPLTGPPMAGYRTLIDSGTGTNTLGGNVTFVKAGSGWAQISGNLSLNNASRDFGVADGDILNELVVDAAIVGGGANGALTKSGTGRLVLGGSNSYAGATTVNQGFLQITNANALGTTAAGTTVSSGGTLELLGNIAVGNEALTLSGIGMTVGSYAVGGLRNFSGDNTWGGPVTLGAASRINSDSGTLLITNTLNLQNFGLTVGSYGNVTLSGVISGTAGLTKDGLGTLTLAGDGANTFTNLTTVSDGTLVLAKTAGVAVSNLTINGTYGQYCSVRYATNSANNPMIGGTVTLTGAGQLDFNGSTDTIAVVTINSTAAVVDSQPIVNTGSGGQLTINALNITPLNEYITKLDSGTNGVLRLGGNVTFTAVTAGQGTLSGILDLGAGTRTFNVGLGTGPIYDLGISAVIANGALTKTGTGRLYLSAVNTYAGDTLVSAGTLEVAATGSILNSPTVTVGQNATLQTDSTNALGANATLALVSDGLNANYGKANLNFVGTQTVAVLRFDGVAQGGTWGSTSSTAANKTDTWFSGTGVVLVNGPQIQNEIVTNVSDTAATFNGWLVSGGPATVGVLWGTTDGSVSGAWANTNWFDGTVSDNTHLSTNIASLTTGIPYYYTFVASNASAVVRAAPSVSFVPSSGTTKTWLTTGTTDLMASGNWSPTGVPDATCNLIINTAGGKQPLLNLSGGSVTIKSLSIGATAATTLTITNGNVDTKILNVTGDVTIGPNGILTHAADWSTQTTLGSESNRLCMSIGGNLTIASGGQINVDAMGYAATKGPGYANGTGGRDGGSYGGQGGYFSSYGTLTTYGSITNPVNNGSGGGTGRGGGTVVLQVTGAVTHNGVITALGANSAGTPGSGSGGAINIRAGSIAGSTGILRADGGQGTANGAGSGGGGRIAVIVASATIPDSIRTNITAYGRTGPALPQNSAAGTIYIKTSSQSYGDLIVNNGNVVTTVSYTPLRDGTYQFDSIITTNRGVFTVGTNATLNLDGCTLRSDSTTNSITSRLIVATDQGGTLNWTGTWTNNGCISWKGTNLLSVSGSMTVVSNAFLTHEAYSPNNKLRLNLTGNLTIDAGGAIYVSGLGDAGTGNPGANRAGGGYGGEGGYATTYGGTTYDSITNPVLGGSKGLTGSPTPRWGGGVVIIQVTGAITNNGAIVANGQGTGNLLGAGSGGAINLTAGSLAGGGPIKVDGGYFDTGNNSDAGNDCPGGGGRIAVVLTNSATFGSVTMTANAGTAGSTGTKCGGAGTIYLRGTNSAYGRLIVPWSGGTQRTLISTQTTDAVVGDVELQSGALLAIAATKVLTVYGNWTNAAATNAISGGTVEFAGAAPATIWGGNTWSNLTIIASADKTVNFEAGKTQFVYGVAAFTNVTLQSTVLNTQWHLRKPGIGTQYVGRVTVYDSHAGTNTTHNMFWGAVGSVVSDPQNVNWDAFKAKGTMIMLR